MVKQGVAFQKDILVDLIDNGEKGVLCVLGAGLGSTDIICHFVKLYSSSSFLVFIINASVEEEAEVLIESAKYGLPVMPHSIDSATKSSERELAYAAGGIVFITPVVLLMDFLQQRIPKKGVSGLILNSVERVKKHSPESFIVKLFRELDYKHGFVRALTSRAADLAPRVVDVLDILELRKIVLWPRFRDKVMESLDHMQPDVVELYDNPTSAVMKIQKSLIVLLKACLAEMRNAIGEENASQYTLQNALFKFKAISKTFDDMDSLTRRGKAKIRQLEDDLVILRNLCLLLNKLDAISFFAFLNSQQDIMSRRTLWTTFEETSTIFKLARGRCFVPGDDHDSVVPLPEANPKWKLLISVLNEIGNSNSSDNPDDILILCKDEMMVAQVSSVITTSPQLYLSEMYNKLLVGTYPSVKPIRINPIKGETNGGEEDTSLPEHIHIRSSSTVSPLHDLEPKYVIMYDPEIRFIRQVEMYHSENRDKNTRVYFLLLKNSFEEEHFKGTVRRENEAFDHLIKFKAKVTNISVEDDPSAVISSEDVASTASTAVIPPTEGSAISPSVSALKPSSGKNRGIVVVDTRELRSTVPYLLYEAGYKIAIQQLIVGDYILTPSICIERKGYRDLVQSLKSGRIFKQLDSLCKYYAYPILLIEFEREDAPFSLFNDGSPSPVITRSSPLHLLSLVIFHYPKLKTVWLKSEDIPLFFERIKKGAPEPDATAAVKVGNPSVDGYADLANQSIEFLLKCPGINRENYTSITRKVKNVRELSKMSLASLIPLIGTRNAKLLHDFFNTPYK